MKKEEYGFAIIGCGAIARLHADALRNTKKARLIGVFDEVSAYAEKFAQEKRCGIFTSLEELLSDDSVDVVSICTPSGLHAEQAVAVANAKKHLVIEKPMAITKEQLSAVVSAVQKNGVKCEVISQFRFIEPVRKIKNAIDGGKLGVIYHADFRLPYFRSQEYYDKGAWRGTWAMDGGGALMNQGIHGVDVIQYLMGGIKSVYADCRTMGRNIEVEDSVNALVEYENGAIGVIQATTLAYPGFQKTIEITAENGCVVLTEDAITAWEVKGEEYEVSGGSAINAGADPMAIPPTYHTLQFEDIISAIENDVKPIVNENDGEEIAKIVLAIYESAREGKRIYL